MTAGLDVRTFVGDEYQLLLLLLSDNLMGLLK